MSVKARETLDWSSRGNTAFYDQCNIPSDIKSSTSAPIDNNRTNDYRKYTTLSE